MRGRTSFYRTFLILFTSILVLSALYQSPPHAQSIAEKRIAVHDAGKQKLGISNDGEIGIGFIDSLLTLGLEYPKDSGTVFLFSGGIWIGAIWNDEYRVSVTKDDDDGTNEFGQLEFGPYSLDSEENPVSMGWLQKTTVPVTTEDREAALEQGIFLGSGRIGIDDDGDGLIDEDPAGDISADFIDNDNDGLIDADDPDFDGDLVPGDCDDDGDSLMDEDDSAQADQEFIAVYVDTCETCVERLNTEGFNPLGILVEQHSYQWSAPYSDDFVRFDFKIRNIGSVLLEDLCFGTLFDFDVGHIGQDGNTRSIDDLTYFFDGLRLAVGADNDGDNGLLSSCAFGVHVFIQDSSNPQTTYLNFNQLTTGEPETDFNRYVGMSSGSRNPDARPGERNDWRMLLAVGPLGDLSPNESIDVSVAIVNGMNDHQLKAAARTAELLLDPDFTGPFAPGPPIFSVDSGSRFARVIWDNSSESSVDPVLDDIDFQGYNIWRSSGGDLWSLIATYDIPDTIGLNAGWPPPVSSDGDSIYSFTDSLLTNGLTYRYVVTAFDNGDNGDDIHTEAWDELNNGVGIMESPITDNTWIEVIPAEAAADSGEIDEVYVVPNPYIGSNRLEQSAYNRIDFRGLPPECTITIYTVAGDKVRSVSHESGLSWESWDLRNDEGNIVAPGVYLYRIKSRNNERIGKFAIVR